MLPGQSRKCYLPYAIYKNTSRERRRAKLSMTSRKNTSASLQAITVPSNLHPAMPKNALTKVGETDRSNVPQEYVNLVSPNASDKDAKGHNTRASIVRAVGILRNNSTTGTIDVNMLSQENVSILHDIEIAESMGWLYCVNNKIFPTNTAFHWLKMITLAKDCCSFNVILTIKNEGVVLQTVRNINPGESLQMWFSEQILQMLNIPILTPMNIQGKTRYTCNVCNDIFEYPNPLKLHLALKCNRLDESHIWTLLANRLAASTSSRNLSSPYLQTSLTLQLTSPTIPITALSPILTETTTYAGMPLKKDSPSSLNQLSPQSSRSSSRSSSNQTSPSSNQLSPLCLTLSSLERITSSLSEDTASHHRSAFKPYVQEKNDNPTAPCNSRLQSMIPNLEGIHPAEVETVVSRMGKSIDGHQCLFCGKHYTRKYGLKIHLRTHTGYKPLHCTFCQRAFGDPSNLNKHVRLHAEGDTPYKCELCGKVLVRRRDLERHMKSRHQPGDENVSETSSVEIDVVGAAASPQE